jgi:hypothetical protein
MLDAHKGCTRVQLHAPQLLVIQPRALRQLCRAPRLLVSGCTRSTSTSSCTASTRLHSPGCSDYFTFAARPGASARCAARHVARRAAHRRLPRARRRLLHLRRASGCLGTSRGSSRGSLRRSSSTTPPRAGSSLTTLPPPRVRVPRHVARLVTQLVALLVVDYSASRRLVVDYFAFAARPGASARRAVRRRLLPLRRVSGCLGTSRGSSSTTPPRPGSSSTTPPRVWVPRHIARLITWLVAPLVVDYSASRSLVVDYSVRRDFVLRPHWLYFSHAVGATTCLATTLALPRVRRAPPRRRLPVASRRPFISTNFPN